MSRIASITLFCGLLLSPLHFWGQKLSVEALEQFKKAEAEFMPTVDSMNRIGILDERISYAHDFVKALSQVLKQENSFAYPFEELSTKIHIIYPEDKSFRIFNWPVEYAPAHFRYYGAIQKSDGTVIPLVDYSKKIEEIDPHKVFDNKTWFGQEYYRILTQKGPDGKPLYFVFGVHHDRQNTTIKMMDVLQFAGDKVTFGAPYFEKGNYRFVMEYQKGAQVSLNWDAERSMVVFDVLESEVSQPQRKHTLVANGELDALKWTNYQWQWVPNILPVLKLKDGQAPINGVIPELRN